MQEHHHRFSKVNGVTALQTLAKLPLTMRSGFESHAAWPLLLAAVQHSIPHFDARQLSGCVSACAALSVQPAWLPQLLATAEASMQTKPQAWSLRYLATCVTGLAKLQYEGDCLVWTAAEQLLPQLLPGADARGIANAVWSFGKAQRALHCDVVNVICVRFLEVLPQAAPQNVANLLYGLAIMGAAPDKQLLEACAEHLASTTGRDAQFISNTIWALGELGHCPSDVHLQALLHADILKVCVRLLQSSRFHELTLSDACRCPPSRIAARSCVGWMPCHSILGRATCMLLLRG